MFMETRVMYLQYKNIGKVEFFSFLLEEIIGDRTFLIPLNMPYELEWARKYIVGEVIPNITGGEDTVSHTILEKPATSVLESPPNRLELRYQMPKEVKCAALFLEPGYHTRDFSDLSPQKVEAFIESINKALRGN